MVKYKSAEEFALIRESADLLGRAHAEVAKIVKAGVKTIELDKRAEEFIRDHGAYPSFKGFNGFPSSLCISVNEVVVHGFPSEYVLKEGDIVSIDCGVLLNGYHSDSAYTYPVGTINQQTKKLLEITKKSLYDGIDQFLSGGRIGDVGYAIQQTVQAHHFTVVRELVGHGVGRELHEEPDVPNYGKRGKGSKIQEGLVIAIEPMVNMGTRHVVQEKDGWTIRTQDRKPSAHFEHTVGILNGKPEILTTFKYIEQVLNS
ncbi:MAG TPA: type I methionyl aminopeptidase [Microscillaceae bacterium]|jgi:methionyl aminopeptidase|nr:type I methionyl aminopeptidase [Microscillaceae bacterium]